jgi:hypothetical protein
MYVREAVAKLFRATPNDNKFCFVKEEVSGIADGGPIIGPDHPAMLEMFALPIAGAICCSKVKFKTDRCAGLAANYQAKVLFEQANSGDNAETTVLQNRMHSSQQKFFNLLGAHLHATLMLSL